MKNKIMTTSGKLLSVFVLLTIFGVACSSSDESQRQQKEPIPVVTQQAGYLQGATMYHYSGNVSSDHSTNMSTKVMGRIIELNVEEGDFAEKGEVLVRIKDDNLKAQKNQVQAQLIQARAGLKNTETNHNRIKALFEQNSATQKELDDISTRYEMAKAEVQTLENKLQEVEDILEYATLRAPFDGYVVSKMASEGDMATPGQPIITLEQDNMLKVNITVPESELGLFSLNDTVSVDVTAAGYLNAKGIIANINRSGNHGSRQFAVEVVLPKLDKSSGVRSGMYAEVGIRSANDRTLTVPQSAIVERGQLTGLYTLNNESEVVLRWVRLGDKTGNQVEVLSGLSAGEQYVARVDRPFIEGQQVTVQE
ncbi:MAG: efflux RND transporter periplasmic adaptor subunit [Balneolaceae bacterium]|nr:efflux RND transporter periplasmic adaptor subunit [Balneolaceae bacterium]